MIVSKFGISSSRGPPFSGSMLVLGSVALLATDKKSRMLDHSFENKLAKIFSGQLRPSPKSGVLGHLKKLFPIHNHHLLVFAYFKGISILKGAVGGPGSFFAGEVDI